MVFLCYLLNCDIHHMFYPRRIPLLHDHAEWSQSLYLQRTPAAERPRASKLYGKSEAYHQRDQWDLLNVVMKKPLQVNNLTESAFNEISKKHKSICLLVFVFYLVELPQLRQVLAT